MFCKSCGNQLHDQAIICPKCGCSPTSPLQSEPHITYILLGIIVGLFLPGIHNIYIGNNRKGTIQILCTIASCWILWLPMYIWTIIDICKYNKGI